MNDLKKAQMRKPQRIGSEKAVEELLSRPVQPRDPSVKSKIGPPSPSVPIVLDGKRVEYREVARLNGQPLDYVAGKLKGGESALVVYSDQSVMRNYLLRQFDQSLQPISQMVDNALLAGGLQPATTFTGIDMQPPPMTFIGSDELGLRFFEDVDFGGDSCALAPEGYIDDLSEFDEHTSGDWNDKISSIGIIARCYCVFWADRYEGGERFIIYRDERNLHNLGWGDRISTIWAPFSN